jgi:hypothetical protein
MAAGNSYPVDLADAASGVVKASGTLSFTDSTNQPTPNAPPITSGALPNTGAWVSGTAKINPVSRPIVVAVEVVGDATNNLASCVIAISPDNATFTTLGTPSIAAAINTSGAITLLTNVSLPQGWYIKLTLTHVTVAASKYY